MISFIKNNCTTRVEDKTNIREWIKAETIRHGKELGEISIILCGDKEILEANKTYLNHNYLTDIITFNYNEGEIISGDLYLGMSTIKDNATQYKVKYQEEIKRVIIHGVLHLIGFNDKTEAEQRTMTKMENESLENYKQMFHVKQS